MRRSFVVRAVVAALSLWIGQAAWAQDAGAVPDSSDGGLTSAEISSHLGDFAGWAQGYVANPTGTTLSEGVDLARARREAMAALIVRDPSAALEATLPESLRQQLPSAVLGELEDYVSGIGELTVLCPFPTRDDRRTLTIERFATIAGTTYRAYVFGRRAAQTTKTGIPLHGVLANGLIALDDRPVRVLPATAAVQSGRPVQNLGQSAGMTSQARYAEIGATLYRFDSEDQLQAIEAALVEAEAGYGPTPTRSAENLLESIAPGGVPTPPGAGPANGGSPWTEGVKRVLVIRVDFSDIPGDPNSFGIVSTADYCQALMDDEVTPYYEKSSYGLTTLSNTVTTQLYRMPQTAADYASSGDNGGLHEDARTLAAADYTLADYDRIVVVFAFLGNLPNSLINYGGLAQLGGPNVWVNGEFDFRIMSHELGHTYGLYHTALWDVDDGDPISPTGENIEYGDIFDTMGANFANTAEVDFNPFFKWQLDWIADSQILDISLDGSFRLHAFDWENYLAVPTNSPLALRYVKDNVRTYWISVRRNFLQNGFIQNGAYIFWAYSTPGAAGGGGYQTGLLDMNTPGEPPTPGLDDEYDCALGVGSFFTDPSIGLTIIPLENGGMLPDGYLDIQIGSGGPGSPRLEVLTNYVQLGNGNGLVDTNECNDLRIVLTNAAAFDATGIQATLSTLTPGVIVTRATSSYPDVESLGATTNEPAFQFSTSDTFPCGAEIHFTLSIKSDQVTQTNRFLLPSGRPGVALRYNNNTPVPIPDDSPLGGSSPITVSGFPATLAKATLALHITHTWDSDLVLELISPNGITNTLSANNGGSGDNYGVSCLDGQRSTFDDAAATDIEAGNPPFVGTFRPSEPLAVFQGLPVNLVNGVWTLRAVDEVGLDTGAIQCWSLFLTPAECDDGGGTCPGSDVAIGIRDLPDPVTQGSNLTYTVTVTNNGPSPAKGVVFSQQLPPSALFVSGTITKGSISHGGGFVTGNIGDLGVGQVVTATVRVTPTQVGQISSLVTVSAVSDVDFNPANNAATTVTRVDPPLAELAVGFFDTPDPVLQGGVLTYTTYVTNNGPSIATGVTVTNLLPISAPILSAVASQGSVSVLSNLVTATLGSLSNGATASLTVSVRPLLEGSLQAFAGATALQPDPVPSNNTKTVQTVVGPATDLALGMTVNPASAVVGSNFTALISVTNLGPSPASSVVVNHVVPAGATVVSSTPSQGTSGVSNGIVVASLGVLSNAATATVTVVMRSTNIGQFLTTATVSGPQADPALANNTAFQTVTVALPFVLIEAAGATLTSESFSPPNGAVEIGETNTVILRLRNRGNVPALSTVATLQSGNGVGSPSEAQSYGDLPPGGLAVGRPFTFTAQGSPGGTVEANLAVTTNGVSQSTVSYSFSLPKVWVFSQTNRLSIPDSGVASNYPSTILVSGVTGTVGRVVAVLSNLTHTFPQDIDALLKGPGPERSIVMSDAGGTTPANSVTLTFDDQASAPIAQGAQLVSGSFRPADYEPGDSFTPPAPVGPYSAAMSQFNGLNPNGTWSLFVSDDTPGDQGQVANGWVLRIHTVTPVNQVTDLQMLGTVSPPGLEAGDMVTMSFIVTNAGPDGATSVVFTNVLPSGLSFSSAASSQGSVSHAGGTVSGVIGDLAAGAAATVTIMGVPQVSGLLTNLASVFGSEIDLNPVNNLLGLAVNAGQPVADGFLAGSTMPEPAVTGNEVTYNLLVTNVGPGTLLDARVTNTLPAGMNFVSASVSAGSVTNTGGIVVASLGNLASNATAAISVVAVATVPGLSTNVATLSTASGDPVSTNNTLTLVSSVESPAPKLVAAGAFITSEDKEKNGTADAGEQVTVELALENVGQLNTTNLQATLATQGGLASPNPVQNYDVVLAGGPAVSRPFTFTAGAGPGPVTATLQLSDGTANLGQVQYVFELPASSSLANTSPVSIPELGAANVYPSTIQVAGVTGLVNGVQVTLSNLSHQFPDDLDILLVSPTGVRVMLMSDCGGGNAISNRVLTFSDAATGLLPNSSAIAPGTYKPTDYESGDVLPPPAPVGVPAMMMASINGTDPNGTWSLFIADDSAGDAGLLAGGWSLTLTIVQPANPAANLNVSASVTPDSGFVGSLFTYTIQVFNAGPDTASGVTLTNILPTAFNFVSATAPQGTYTNLAGQVVFSLGEISAGAVLPVTIVAAPQLPGAGVNQTRVSSVATDLNPADNLTTVMASVVDAVPPSVTASFDSGADQFTVIVQGTPGQSYVVESTTNFVNWTLRTNGVAESGVLKFVESPASANSALYYRAYRVP